MLSLRPLVNILLLFKLVLSTPVLSPTADAQVEEYLSTARTEFVQTLDHLQEFLWSEKYDQSVDVEKYSGHLINITRNLYEQLKVYSPDDLESDILKRALKRWTYTKYAALNDSDMVVYLTASGNFEQKARIPTFCDYHDEDNCNLSYIPDIRERIAAAKTADELKFHWQQWRNIAHPDEKEIISYLIEIYRKVAVGSDLPPSSFWYLQYDEDNFIFELSSVMEQLRPLYLQLHAYLRHKLRAKFGEELVPRNQPIAQHLMDQAFTQATMADVELDLPYPDSPLPNVTKHLIDKGYAPLRMFQVSDEFFNSLGMQRVSDNFWTEKTKPSRDTSHDCKNRVLTFSDDDIRVMHCSRVGLGEMRNAIDTMTRVHYEIEKKNSSLLLGPQTCPGFTNAISRAVKLSMWTPANLEKLGFIKEEGVTHDFQINRLYKLALTSLLELPTHYVYESLWVGLLNALITVDNISRTYWDILHQFAGIAPPSDEAVSSILPYEFLKGLSPVEPNTQYIFSEVLGYQIYEELCKISGKYDENDPMSVLNECDLQGSEEAGKALSRIMSFGGMRSWREVIEVLIPNRKLNTDALLKYYEPLYLWLKEENAKNGEEIGWINLVPIQELR